MIIPKPVRKFIAVFRGDVAPVLIVLSCLLGFWFGLVPGWYGVHVALLILALILNVHFGIFLMLAALGKCLAFAAAPVLYHTGVWLHAHASGLLTFCGALPVVGITDFSRYAVAGAMVLGPVVGLIIGLGLARAVIKFRTSWLVLEEKSEALVRWRSKKWVRFLERLLIGKSAPDVRAVLTRRPKLIRTSGVAAAVVVVAACGVGLLVTDDEALADVAARSLTKANGAEVNLRKLELAALSGRVSAWDVQMTDPDDAARNRVAVGKITADASLWNLLAGKLVMDEVELSEVAFDQPRERPGEILVKGETAEDVAYDPARFGLTDASARELSRYFKDGRAVREQLTKLQEWLPSGEEKEAAAEPRTVPEDYLGYLAARAPRSPEPRVLIRKITLDGIEFAQPELGRSRVVCANLSDAPQAAGLPLTIEVKSNQRPTSIKVVSHYEAPQQGAEVEATLDEIDLRTLQSRLNQANPVTLQGGTASARIEGKASREQLDLAIKIKTKDMQASAAGGGLFGLDPQVTSEAVKALQNLETTFRVVGPTTDPRLVLDGQAMSREFRDALVRAGKDELARRADELLAGQVPGVEAGKILDEPEAQAKAALSGFLKGKPSEEKDQAEEAEKSEEKKKEEDSVSKLKKSLLGGNK